VGQEHGRGIQIDEDLAFQRRSWRAQSLGLALMAVVLAGALLGLLGAEGPFSQGEARAAGLSVRYSRFGRRLSPSTLQVRLDPSRVRGDVVSLWISADYLEAMSVERVSPRPRAVVASAERTVYTFDVSAAPSRSSRPILIAFELKPRALFRRGGQLGLDAGAELSVATFVYP
jgi:hypothetical protein